MSRGTWVKVTKSQRCPICGRPDWCRISSDGELCECPRTPSNKPIYSPGGAFVGYLHKIGDQRHIHIDLTKVKKEAPRKSNGEIAALAAKAKTNLSPNKLDTFARQMGLSTESLKRLGIGWLYKEELHEARTTCKAEGAWTFPMMDAKGRIIGIRLRSPDGFKYSISGGDSGLFIPADLPDGQLCICEGPTSCAALLDLGFACIGRPSCSSGNALVTQLLYKQRRPVVVFGDHDEAKPRPDGTVFYPGQDGAEKLAKELAAMRLRVQVVIPPFDKDARDWKKSGATHDGVAAVIKAANYVV